MFHGIEDTINWFVRTNKKGWRLSRGKDTIAEYFNEEASNDSARQALEVELQTLRGGTYHIDAKDAADVTRKILGTDFIIHPGVNQASVGHAHTNNHILDGYVSKADMYEEIQKAVRQRDLEKENEELKDALEQLAKEKTPKEDFIGSLLKNPQVQSLIPVIVGKIMGQNVTQPMAYTKVGITGPAINVPPMSNDETVNESENEIESDESLSEEQDEKLTNAFFDLSDIVGSIDETIVLIECLPNYIKANEQMYKAILLPELLKYKK